MSDSGLTLSLEGSFTDIIVRGDTLLGLLLLVLGVPHHSVLCPAINDHKHECGVLEHDLYNISSVSKNHYSIVFTCLQCIEGDTCLDGPDDG